MRQQTRTITIQARHCVSRDTKPVGALRLVTTTKNIHVKDCLEAAHEKMAALEKEFPGWFNLSNNLDFGSATRAELMQAMAQAPHEFLAGMVYGTMIFRTSMDQICARESLTASSDKA